MPVLSLDVRLTRNKSKPKPNFYRLFLACDLAVFLMLFGICCCYFFAGLFVLDLAQMQH